MIAVAAALTALAVLLLPNQRRRPVERLSFGGAAVAAEVASPTTAAATATSLRRPIVAVGLVGTALMMVAGQTWLTLAIPVVVAGAVLRHGRRRSCPELPLVVDLLAASLRGGALLPAAIEVAAGAATSELRPRLAAVAGTLRAGDDVAAAWAACHADPDLAQVARICVRTGGSGAAAATELERLATRLRARRRTDVDARSARAAVWVVLPLCLCFLPAFVLVGVVPMAVGLLERVR